MNTDIQDQIDRYLMGRMNTEEQKQFEKQLQENAALQAQLEFTGSVRTVLTRKEEKRKLLAGFKQRYQAERKLDGAVQKVPLRSSGWKRSILLFGGVAAAAVLVCGLFWSVPQEQSEEFVRGDDTVFETDSAVTDTVRTLQTGSQPKENIKPESHE